MKVGLITNLKKDKDMIHTKRIIHWVEKYRGTILMPEEMGIQLDREDLVEELSNVYSASDILVVLGGDGTLLNSARIAAPFFTPILGVNLGTLGFLAEVEAYSALEALEQVFQGDYNVEERMMLESTIVSNQTVEESYIALNDAVITRGTFSRIIKLHIFINNQFVDVFSADGIIVSTPTGSTGYNLSAGGPILNPATEMMVITPICPHSLSARSIVVSAKDIVKIQIGGDDQNISKSNLMSVIPYSNKNFYVSDIMLTLDGQEGYRLKPNDHIIIKKSNFTTLLIKTSKQSFYDILRKKM